MMKIHHVLGMFLVVLALAAMPAHDAVAASTGNSGSGSAPGSDDSFHRGERAVKAEDWRLAVKYLTKAVRLNPRNADAFNLLAYSYRRLGKLDPAFENYKKALRVNDRHLGAHEYIGEAYLMVGNVEKARGHLARLKEICGNGCAEVKMLEQSIARHEQDDREARLDADW